MFPFFEILPETFIYSFGIALALCFFFFLWNLKRLGKRFWYSFAFFSQNILWFFISIFIFSRLFYVIAQWHNMKFIREPFQFFIMSEYNFSLFGAIFWFLLVLALLVRLEGSTMKKYIDGVVLSFLFIMVIWYIGAFFGWQVYGRETTFWIEITYTNPYSLVPSQLPVFPLPIVYSIISFLIFSTMYILSLFIHVRWYIGYMWMLFFSAMILWWEYFSGKQDILSVETSINLPQVCAFILILWSAYQLFWIFKEDTIVAWSRQTLER